MSLTAETSVLMSFVITFLAGITSSLGPCTVPTIMLVAGYVTGSHKFSPKKGALVAVFFTLGMIAVFSVLGYLLGFIGGWFTGTKVIEYVFDLVLIVMGLWLVGAFNVYVGQNTLFNPKKGSGYLGAFLMGALMALIASPCTMPITLSTMAYAASKGNALYSMGLMTGFAIGRGIPLVLFTFFAGWIRSNNWYAKYQVLLEKAIGYGMIAYGLYRLWVA